MTNFERFESTQIRCGETVITTNTIGSQCEQRIPEKIGYPDFYCGIASPVVPDQYLWGVGYMAESSSSSTSDSQ